MEAQLLIIRFQDFQVEGVYVLMSSSFSINKWTICSQLRRKMALYHINYLFIFGSVLEPQRIENAIDLKHDDFVYILY